ncbi:MAG: CotH kinase family protein [Myxococcota bacterium]
MRLGSGVVFAAVLSLGGCNDTPAATDDSDSSGSATDAATDADDSGGTDADDADGTAAPSCAADNQAPQAPYIVTPPPGARNLEPETLLIQSSAFDDPDGDAHAFSEFEIWRLNGGEPVERVWSATISEPSSLDRVTLDQGQLHGTAELDGHLAQWRNHVVRARYNDGSEGDCGYSEWSPDVDFRTDDGSQYLFDQSVIRDIYLEIPEQSALPIHEQAVPPKCIPWDREFYVGSMTYEGQQFDGIGIRAKGGCGSARGLDEKAGFRINLGWDDPDVPGCPENQRLYGQDHLTLNNMVQDPSFSHERLAYRVYQAFGVPTPRVAHIRVHVNGELWGLYLLVETPKRRFLDRRFQSKNGMLYEGTYWCDLIEPNVPPGDEDTYCLQRKFSPGACDGAPEPDEDPKDYELLRTLVADLDALSMGSFYPEIEGVFNFEDFLSAWAVEGAIGHWDNYAFEINNNYRVYHHPATGLWNLLPHGVDQTFEDSLDPWLVEGVIAVNCMQEGACEAAFADRFAQVGETMAGLDLAAELDVIHDLITEDVYADPRKEVSDEEYELAQQLTREWIQQRPDEIVELLAVHGF